MHSFPELAQSATRKRNSFLQGTHPDPDPYPTTDLVLYRTRPPLTLSGKKTLWKLAFPERHGFPSVCLCLLPRLEMLFVIASLLFYLLPQEQPGLSLATLRSKVKGWDGGGAMLIGISPLQNKMRAVNGILRISCTTPYIHTSIPPPLFIILL